jgi:ferredoxin-NADP reductase
LLILSPDSLIAAPASILALVSTAHVAFLVLRQQRSVRSLGSASVLLPSLALTAAPWLFPAPAWLAAGLGAHLVWFVACERLIPKPAKGRPASHPSPTAPATAPPATLAPGPSQQAPAFQTVPVLAVFEETDEIRTFRMARPEGLEHAAGQFLTVRVQVDGKPLVRCYSISSAPEATGYLEISVKRQGVVSGMLHSTVRPGSMLAIKGPNGNFTYPAGDDRPIVCLAGGVGITPLMSMLRHGVAAAPARPVTLLYSVKTERHIAFRHELEWIVERHPQAKVAIVTSEGPFSIGHFTGHINEAFIRKFVPEVTSSIFMICGPGRMMEAMKQLLASLAVPPPQVRYEAFEAAIAMAKEEPGVGRAPGAPLRHPTAARAGAGHRLTLRQSGVTVPVPRDQSLLEAAEAAGASIPTSCRAGVCLTCRTRLLEGNVECSSDSLDDDDRASGYILPCVSWAKGDCVLDV